MRNVALDIFLFLAIACCVFTSLSLDAYSVLTHKAIFDASWEMNIEPLLKQKYPAVTNSDLLVAHSYAYGGECG